MKRLSLTLLLALAALGAAAQARIETKKYKIADFPDKVTKVVLSGNEMNDVLLRQAVSERWSLSPFEFCGPAEFQTLCKSDQYYFLLIADGDDHLSHLTLVKGGAGAEKGLSAMLQVVSVPFSQAGGPTAEAFVFLPAFLDLIQAYVPKAIEKDRNAYAGISILLAPKSRQHPKRICLSRSDLSPKLEQAQLDKYANETLLIEEAGEAARCFAEEIPDMLVGYVIAPADAVPGADSYRLLIDAGTHELYYYKHDKIARGGEVGFTADELKKFSRW